LVPWGVRERIDRGGDIYLGRDVGDGAKIPAELTGVVGSKSGRDVHSKYMLVRIYWCGILKAHERSAAP